MLNSMDPPRYDATASALLESEESNRPVVPTHSVLPSEHDPDITAVRKATDALRKREAQLQGLLAHSPSVVFIKDCAGRFEFINRAYETLYAVRSCHRRVYNFQNAEVKFST